MATKRQIAANRRNARLCTGPRSAAGRARSSQNALKTGIDAKADVIRAESREDYNALTAECYAHHSPATPEERCLVDGLIRAEWLSRRYMKVATSLWENSLDTTGNPDRAGIFLERSAKICRAQRRFNSTRRIFAAIVKRLCSLQKIAAQPYKNKPLNPKLVSFLHFSVIAASDHLTRPVLPSKATCLLAQAA